MEQRRGVADLGIFEEGRVERPGRIVERHEHHPLTRSDRWGLRRDLHPCDQDLLPAPATQQVARPGRAEVGEKRCVGLHHVAAHIQTEDVELSPDPLGPAHLGQPARPGPLGCVAEVEGELDVDRLGHRCGLRLPGRPRPYIVERHQLPLTARWQRSAPRWQRLAPRSRAGTALAALDRPGPPIELGHLEQQVAPGDLPPSTTGHGGTQAVERVEPPCDDEPLHHRPGHRGAVPEVRQRRVGPAGDDPGDLGVVDALDLGQPDPDAVAPAVGQPQIRWALTGWGLLGSRLLVQDRRRWFVQDPHPLDAVGRSRGVDVDGQDGDPELAGIVEDQPLGIHAWVVGEHPGQEGRRMVCLEPGRLVGRQGERRGMGLAEAERPERLEHLPHPFDDPQVVAAGQCGRHEPDPHLRLALGVAEGAPDLVGLGEGAARHPRHDLQDLLVEHHDAVGLGQRIHQVGVGVFGLPPALPGFKERPHHVALDRPRPEQRDVDDEVLEGLRGELADQLALPRRLDLETAEGLGRLDQGERVGVVPPDPVDVDVLAVDPLHLLYRVGHRGLHPDAEHIELEQAELLDIVLVELAHRKAQPAGLDRGAIEQGPVGQQHPAGVQRDVPWEAVEPLDQAEQQVDASRVLAAGQTAGPQLRQVTHGGPDLVGPDVRERLGERVDLAWRHAQGRPDITDAVPGPVGVHHRHAGAALPAVGREDLLIDLGAAGGLDIEVDVGQLVAQWGQEPLHQQAVADRVDIADPEQVGDQAAGAAAPRRRPHPHPLDEVDDVGHGEEVRRVAELADDVELVLESPQGHRVAGHAAPAEAGLDPLPQHRRRLAGNLQLGEVHLADPEIGAGVDGAAVGLMPGAGEQAPALVGQPGEAGDLFGDVGHLLTREQGGFGVGAVDVPAVEGDQSPGGVEHVGGRGVSPVGIADDVAQHGRGARGGGQTQQPGSAAGVTVAAVGDDLDDDRIAAENVAPGVEMGQRQVGSAGTHRPAELGGRAEQHRQRPGLGGRPGVLGDQVEAADRVAPLPRQVGGRDEPAECGPTPAVAGEQDHPGSAGRAG